MLGSIFGKKKELIVRIKEAQRVLSINPNRYLIRLNKKCNDELNLNLHQKETLWYQKSKEKWITQGDRNTSYFHLSIVVLRRRNKLEGLFNQDNTWIDSKEDLKVLIEQYFTDLFTDNHALGILNA